MSGMQTLEGANMAENFASTSVQDSGCNERGAVMQKPLESTNTSADGNFFSSWNLNIFSPELGSGRCVYPWRDDRDIDNNMWAAWGWWLLNSLAATCTPLSRLLNNSFPPIRHEASDFNVCVFILSISLAITTKTIINCQALYSVLIFIPSHFHPRSRFNARSIVCRSLNVILKNDFRRFLFRFHSSCRSLSRMVMFLKPFTMYIPSSSALIAVVMTMIREWEKKYFSEVFSLQATCFVQCKFRTFKTTHSAAM